MRNRTALTLILGLIVGISGAAYVSNAKKMRLPASMEQKSSAWTPAPIGKHLALLKVEILAPKNIPESGNEDVTLSGRILVNQELQSDLSYNWDLPEDVQVVDGQLQDSFSGVKMGQIVEVKITVSGFNQERQRLISLQASTTHGHQLLGGSAVVSSRPGDTWEAVAPDMKRIADEQLGSGAKAGRR